MGNSIQDRIINNLADEITDISPADLEKISSRLVEQITGESMQEFGVNSNGMPVGGTVDGTSGNSNIIYECTTEQKYFKDKTFKKITKDIEHAIRYNPIAKNLKIFLISSQKEPTKFRQGFNEYKSKKYQQYDISIYAARKIADLIYEATIENVQAKSFYYDYFPRFALDMEKYTYYGTPQKHCDKYVSDKLNLSNIEVHFKNYPVCVWCGLSGAGKTELAIEFSDLQKEKGMNILWINGEDWKEKRSFCNIKGTRGASGINVAGNFNSCRTLLIIDDLKRKIVKSDFEELKKGFQLGSLVLVTSQFYNTNEEYYLRISEFSTDSLKQILGEDKQIISYYGKLVLQKCKFLPLMLATIRNLIERKGIEREEIYKNILSYPEDLKDETGKSVMARILSNLEENDYKALEKIANSKVHVYEKSFLKSFIRPILYLNLCELSIIQQDSIPGFVRVHDLICKAVFTREETYGLTMSLEKYLNENHGEISAGMLEQIYLCREALIYEEENNSNRHWISYALLQIVGKQERSVYRKYYKKTFARNMDISLILCMIDSREVCYYEPNKSKEEKDKYLGKCAEEYLDAIENMGYSNDIKAILWHHRGKALRRCHKLEDALESFCRAIELKPEYYSSYAQIAQLGSLKSGKRFRGDGERALRKLFDLWKESKDKIPLRVMLLAIIKMRSYRNIMRQLDSDNVLVKQLGDIIVMSAIDGSGQFYDAFVSFTTAFGYHHAEKCISLIRKVPLIRSMKSQNIETTQWISACEALANLIFSAEKIQDVTFSSTIKEITFSFTEDIVEKISDWDAYKVRAVAKAYNRAGYPQKTLDFIDKHLAECDGNHWILYRRAEAELALSKDDSLQTIRMATEKVLHDLSAEKYIPSYYFLLAKCQEKFEGLNQANASLHKAIENCDDDVYLEELRKYEDELKSKIPSVT